MKKLNISFAEKNQRAPAIFFVAALIVIVTAGVTFARYMLKEDFSGVAEAEPFYFASDLLKEEAEKKVYHIDPETSSFDITIFNFIDSKRITGETILAKVMVTGGTCTTDSFQIVGGAKKEQKVTITPAANVVIVSVTSSQPYEKTLSAEFRMDAGSQYRVEDEAGKRAAVLTITYVEQPPESGVVLKVPANVIPDATNPLVSKEADGTYRFTPKESGVYTLVLLKKDVSLNLSKEEAKIGETNQITIGE